MAINDEFIPVALEITSAATTGRKALSPITNTMQQQQQPGRGNDTSQRTRNAVRYSI